ncbi:MAG: cysteine desulfurase [Deltaproteobacteria bacterium]|nr:cysteine desulfurase [Deltaproteobacteria bacterium]
MSPTDLIYLDHNATTPVYPRVLEAMLPYLRGEYGNPSSGHSLGQRAHAAVEAARAQVARLIDCTPEEVLFTSGGTEANNLALRGVCDANPDERHIVTTTVEHPAISAPCRHLEECGYRVTRVPVGADGRVDPAMVAAAMTVDTLLVTVMLAQNETGALMPVAEIARAAHARGALMHTDAAQAVGKIETRVGDLDVDLLSIAGHKLYAPKGVGALYVRRGVPLKPLLLGAGHERGLRPGTENVPHIVGLGAACELAARDLAVEAKRLTTLTEELWTLLARELPGIRRNGQPHARLPNTLNVSFDGVRGSALLAAAPEIAASTGAACHDGGERPSPVLLAMGVPEASAWGAVRLSLGRSTTTDDVRRAALALSRAYREVKARGA